MITLNDILVVAEATFKIAASKGYSVKNKVTFSINNRLSSTHGRFIVKPEYVRGRECEVYSIDITHRYQSPCDEFVDTVRHEIAHFIAYTSFGDLSHGPLWKKIALDLGAHPRSCAKGDTDSLLVPAEKRKRRLLVRAQCKCCPVIYRANKNQKFQIQRGLMLCPKCKVKKLYLVHV